MNVRKSLGWSFSQAVWQKVLQFGGSIAIARLLTPDELGVFAIAMAGTFLISSLQSFGIGAFLIREKELTESKIRSTFGMWLLVSGAVGILILLSRDPMAVLYETPGISDVLLLVGLAFFVMPLGQPAQALITRDMRFDVLHHIALAETTIRLGIGITMAYLGFSYMALAWGMLAGTIARAGMLLTMRSEHLRLRPGLRHWREIARFGGWVSAASGLGTCASEGVKLMLGAMITPGAVAIFERAGQLPNFSRKMLFMPLGRVLYPAFAAEIRRGRSIDEPLTKVVSATTAVIWPAFLALAFVSEPVILFLFGENWRQAGEILPYLLLPGALPALLPQPEQILIPHGAVKRLCALRALQTVTSFGLGALGALYSLEMFVLSRIPGGFLFMMAFLVLAWPFLRGAVRRFGHHYLLSAGLSVVTAVPAALVWARYGAEIPVPVLLAAGMATPVFWLAGLLLLRHPLGAELKGLPVIGKWVGRAYAW